MTAARKVYRVLRHDGSVLTDALPHGAGATAEHYGLQRGSPMPTLGGLDLPLPPPKGRPAAVTDLLAQLRHDYRIERYSEGQKNPDFTGLIDRLNFFSRSASLHAIDSLSLLAKAKTERSQNFNLTSTDLVKYALKDWDLAYGDDFSHEVAGQVNLNSQRRAWWNVAPYLVLQDPTFLANGVATRYPEVWSGYRWAPGVWSRGVPDASYTVTPGLYPLGGGAAALTTAGVGSAGPLPIDYTPPLKFEATFRLSLPPFPTAAVAKSAMGASGGIVFGYQPRDNYYMAWMDLTIIKGSEAQMTVQFAQFSGGSRLVGLGGGLFPPDLNISLPGPLPDADGWTRWTYQLKVLVNEFGVAVYVNDQDLSGNVILFDTSRLSGGVGIRASAGESIAPGGSYPVADQNKLVDCRRLMVFHRVPQFGLAAGFPVTARVIPHTLNKTSCLEALLVAANDMDRDIRKIPRPGMDLIEAGPFVPNTPDLALGKTATADSTLAGTTPAMAVDGDDSTAWTSDATPVGEPTFGAYRPGRSLAVDLAASTTVGSFRVRVPVEPNDAAGGLTKLRLQSSPDNAAWTDRGTFYPAHGDFVAYLDADTTARYWQLQADAGGTGRLSIQTFSLFGAVPAFSDGKTGNVRSGGLQDNSRAYGTSLRLVGGSSGGGNPTSYEAYDLDAIRRVGLRTQEDSLQDVVPYASLVTAGDAMLQLRSSPATAGEVDVNDEAFVGTWRELDQVRVALSTVPGASGWAPIVLGYKDADGSFHKHLFLDQYPIGMARATVQSLLSALEKQVAGSQRGDGLPTSTQLLYTPSQAWPADSYQTTDIIAGAAYRALVWGIKGNLLPGDAQFRIQSYQPHAFGGSTPWVEIDHDGAPQGDFSHTTFLVNYPDTPDPHVRFRISYAGAHLGWTGSIFVYGIG